MCVANTAVEFHKLNELYNTLNLLQRDMYTIRIYTVYIYKHSHNRFNS